MLQMKCNFTFKQFGTFCFTESSELEVVRLKRRVKELEQAYKSLSTLNSNSAGGAGAGAKGESYFVRILSCYVGLLHLFTIRSISFIFV